MELELHQLTLRFERLRKRQPREERALLVSLAYEHGHGGAVSASEMVGTSSFPECLYSPQLF